MNRCFVCGHQADTDSKTHCTLHLGSDLYSKSVADKNAWIYDVINKAKRLMGGER